MLHVFWNLTRARLGVCSSGCGTGSGGAGFSFLCCFSNLSVKVSLYSLRQQRCQTQFFSYIVSAPRVLGRRTFGRDKPAFQSLCKLLCRFWNFARFSASLFPFSFLGLVNTPVLGDFWHIIHFCQFTSSSIFAQRCCIR